MWKNAVQRDPHESTQPLMKTNSRFFFEKKFDQMHNVIPMRTWAFLTSIVVLNVAYCDAQFFETYGVDTPIGDETTYYVDPEFWAPTRQIVWQDFNSNEVWIANIDSTTGALIPADGRGTRLPVTATSIFNDATGVGSFNGPEFGFNGQGLFVYLTVRDANNINQVGRYGPLDRGTPTYTQLSSGGLFNRSGALPTTDGTFPIGATLNTFFDSVDGRIVWRFDDEPNVNRAVVISEIGLKGPRWIPGKLAVATNWPNGVGVTQVAIHDFTASTLKIITDDEGPKSDAFIFDCPEFGSRAAMCLVGPARRELAVYKEASPYWQKVQSFEAPSFLIGGGAAAQIYLAEPFVFQETTYFTFAVGKVNVEELQVLGPSGIYVARLGDETARRVGKRFPAARIDPEFVEINGKAFLYYYTVVPPDEVPLTPPRLHVISDFLPFPDERDDKPRSTNQ